MRHFTLMNPTGTLIKQKQGVFTFVFEAADDVGSGHRTVIVGKSIVELHHVLRGLLAGASRGQGWRTQARYVESPQELLLQVLQYILHVHFVVLLLHQRIHISYSRSRLTPPISVLNRAATQGPLEQQDGEQQEQSLGAADGSQLRDPNARHGVIKCPSQLL